MSACRDQCSRRGLTLVAVMVVMGGAILVATSLLFVAQSELAGISGTEDRTQAHALAWSGAQAVMVQLDEQREDILLGRLPELDEQLTVYEGPTRSGVVRLLPSGPGEERLVAEAGKLDLDAVDEQALLATGLVDEMLAREIVAHRDGLGRPFQSVAELLEVPGVTPDLLYGPVEELGASDAEHIAGEASLGGVGGLAGRRLDTGPRGLADVVTVFSHEPALQQNGRLRINLNTPWSDELGERVRERFGGEAMRALQSIFESGTKFDSERKLFEVLNFFEVPPEDWPDIVDTFTTEDGEFHFGRLDLNTAPFEALAALPGIEPEQVTELVQTRDGLSERDRATIAWPAVQGIIETKQYEDLAGHLTTRSWTWRLRLAAGEVDADDPNGPLLDAVIYETVVDLSSPRPRLGYLRDVTWLRTTALLGQRLTGLAEEDELDDEAPESEPPEDRLEPDAEEDPFADPLEEDIQEAGDDEPEQPEEDEPVGPSGGGDGAPSTTGPDDAETASSSAPASAMAPKRTRRIGRWTAG